MYRYFWLKILPFNTFTEGILSGKWTTGTDLFYVSEHFSERIFQKVNLVELPGLFNLVMSNYSVCMWTTHTWEVKEKEIPLSYYERLNKKYNWCYISYGNELRAIMNLICKNLNCKHILTAKKNPVQMIFHPVTNSKPEIVSHRNPINTLLKQIWI